MESNILFIIIGAIALISGLLLGKFIFAKNTDKLVKDAEDQAKKIIADGQLQAENLKKEKLLEAKEKEKLAYRPRLYLNSSLSLNSVKELRSLNCALRSDSRGWALCGGRGVCEENERLSFNKMAFVVTVLLRFA